VVMYEPKKYQLITKEYYRLLKFTVPDVVTQMKFPEFRAYDNIDD